MKNTKSWDSLIKTRLSKKEIAEIEREAALEAQILRSIKKLITNTVNDYMKRQGIGFNELVRRLEISPSHAIKIKRGQANLTLASLAHILASMGKGPNDFFKIKINKN